MSLIGAVHVPVPFSITERNKLKTGNGFVYLTGNVHCPLTSVVFVQEC